MTCLNGGWAGYVLACLPSMSEEYLKIQEQIDLIKSLRLPPDFIINIKVFHDINTIYTPLNFKINSPYLIN